MRRAEAVFDEEAATFTTTVLLIGREEGNYTLCKGSVRTWLADNRTPALWSPLNRGWWVRSERIPDLLAMAEVDGLIVKVTGS
jgi:hypothetical protein